MISNQTRGHIQSMYILFIFFSFLVLLRTKVTCKKIIGFPETPTPPKIDEYKRILIAFSQHMRINDNTTVVSSYGLNLEACIFIMYHNNCFHTFKPDKSRILLCVVIVFHVFNERRAGTRVCAPKLSAYEQ